MLVWYLHGHSREPKRQIGTDQKESESEGMEDLYLTDQTTGGKTDTNNECTVKSEGHGSSRGDSESFADSGGGVTSSIKSIGLLTYLQNRGGIQSEIKGRRE